jgi:hypothetical protein
MISDLPLCTHAGPDPRLQTENFKLYLPRWVLNWIDDAAKLAEVTRSVAVTAILFCYIEENDSEEVPELADQDEF